MLDQDVKGGCTRYPCECHVVQAPELQSLASDQSSGPGPTHQSQNPHEHRKALAEHHDHGEGQQQERYGGVDVNNAHDNLIDVFPKIPSYRITDMAEAIAPGCRREVVGIRPGEKLHEELITATDSLNTIEFEDDFVILPSSPLWDVNEFKKTFNGEQCPPGFRYNSGLNDKWLTAEHLKTMIKSLSTTVNGE